MLWLPPFNQSFRVLTAQSQAMDRGQPVLLPPGLHQWDSPTIESGGLGEGAMKIEYVPQ